MSYIIDNCTLTAIFRHYYPESFPNFWIKFENLIGEQKIASVREVKKEIEYLKRGDSLEEWTKNNPSFFHDPTVSELNLITKIYSVRHFKQNMDKRKFLQGGPFADPFLIAKAMNNAATLITQEQFKENSARIPNICAHFGIECMDLKSFLQRENWKF